MKKTTAIFTVLILCFALASCAEKPVTENAVQQTNGENILSNMTLEEKVGQMLFVRCPDDDAVSELMSINPAGIIMFGRDFDGLDKEAVTDKINALQAKSKIPLIIAVDEEGGTVVRVSSNPKLAPEKYNSPQQIYKSGGMDALISNTAEKSRLLSGLGITMNLAPVADVSQNENDFMYSRSMGTDAEETAECIKNIVTEMKNNNIQSCLKHFPGYGSTADTHTESASDNRSADTFRQMTLLADGTKTGGDFLPFQAGIDAGADSVLVSHNNVDSLDGENPASLSPAIHDILRSELGFDGVIMTDDIAMGAVADIENVYIKAVIAGNDLLMTTDYMTAYNQILNAVKSGEISEETINKAVEHTLKLKGII